MCSFDRIFMPWIFNWLSDPDTAAHVFDQDKKVSTDLLRGKALKYSSPAQIRLRNTGKSFF